jgi:hypothetical protein
MKNSLDNRIGHQKKGYTDGKISVAWIQDFDQQTKEKVNGHA